MAIFQDLKTWRFGRRFLTMSFACIGGLSTVLQTIVLIFPKVTVFQGVPILLLAVAISLIGGLIWSWPRPIEQDYSAPNTKITIVKGDMLAEMTHLVIGTNDTFDTETPIIIARQSLQGQALERLYGGDLRELDAQLALALSDKPTVGVIEKAGKQIQYGVGTIATVKHAARLIFFLAYCEMDIHNTA
ncbi:macro domain-containing protein, partial [Achromobacter marplatensis]|uniref:macro domain-containing protein n=1 Tax=Achromobacter marplatensis TaxID=470868 RepID=UPI000278049A